MDDTTKTTLYLDAEDYRRLKALAKAEGRPAADMVREAVALYVASRALPARPSSIASGRSGRRDLSERAEQLLDGMGLDPL